ncbi:MAG: FAD-binding domain-containing protein [Psychroserpens sp.]|uniref:cryptochrome/deoxyribodipyrimidine photo-lyase family protein n=1 Tax=Psychroserpens sp. TaxID=2020870 RepID=UPI003C75DE05
MQYINVFWFKRDLRLVDNEALMAAANAKLPLLMIYILEPSLMADEHYSFRHYRFILESIKDLNITLLNFNTQIKLVSNEVIDFFEELKKEYIIKNVYSTEETGLNITFKRDIEFKKYCDSNHILWHEHRNGGVLRGLRNRDTWRDSWYTYMGKTISHIDFSKVNFLNLDSFKFSMVNVFENCDPEVNHKMQIGGRSQGLDWMESFFNERIAYYSEYISKPEMSRFGCSRLSTYIAWGCISIREIYQRCVEEKKNTIYKRQTNAFMSRLRWQAHFIQKFEMEARIEFEAFNKGYLNFPQPTNEVFIAAWKAGKTGYPLVDASIRAVVKTGYLNFRMRSMTVSFLVHHLFQHFSVGSAWLAQQFLDFEPGIHYGQFQMQAGFTATNTIRIYNPTKNALDHDDEAVFIKKYVPELRHLPNDLAIQPWLLTTMEEELYDFKLGETYPSRIVNIEETRKLALEKLYAQRKTSLTKSEKDRILRVHTLKNRFP